MFKFFGMYKASNWTYVFNFDFVVLCSFIANVR